MQINTRFYRSYLARNDYKQYFVFYTVRLFLFLHGMPYKQAAHTEKHKYDRDRDPALDNRENGNGEHGKRNNQKRIGTEIHQLCISFHQ